MSRRSPVISILLRLCFFVLLIVGVLWGLRPEGRRPQPSRISKSIRSTTTSTTTTSKPIATTSRGPVEEIPAQGFLNERIMLVKADGTGYLIQHSLDKGSWIDVDTEGSGNRYVLKEEEGSTDTSMLLKDTSMPLRANFFARVEFDRQLAAVKGNGRVRVGSYCFTKSPEESCASMRQLLCPYGHSCLVQRRNHAHPPRIIHKLRGGAFMELEGGAAWGETNFDEETNEKKPRFFFGTIKDSREELLLFDSYRNIWIRIRPGAPPRGQPPLKAADLRQSTIALSMGAWQNDAQERDLGTLWDVLSQQCDPEVSCLKVRRELDKKLKATNAGPPIHHIFSCDGGKIYHWLAMVYRYWFLKTQRPESTFTRLLSADKDDNLPVPTFLAKPPHNLFKTDHYYPYNKVTAIRQWIKAEHDNLPADQIICIIDVDVTYLEDLSYLAVNVKKGKPMGAHGFMSFIGEDSPYDRVLKRWAPGHEDDAAPLAVPYFLHKTDLLNMVDDWLAKTIEIRHDTQPWSSVKDWRAHPPLQLNWTPEQWAFLLTAANRGLRFETREDASSFTGCTTHDLFEPMIHYSDYVNGMDENNPDQPLKWNKQIDDGLFRLPIIAEDSPCLMDKELAKMLFEARKEVYPEGKGSQPFLGPYSWQEKDAEIRLTGLPR